MFVLSLALSATALPGHASAASYPDHRIRLIVPFPPGGGTDQVGRLFAQKLSEAWGQPVVVENRGGAGGNIGTQVGSMAPPDGYTLTLVTSSVTINQTVYENIPFDVTKDFAPISMLCVAPMAVAVSPKVPVNSVAELVALAKKEPGKLNFGTPGVGTPQHLAAELFDSVTGIKMTHVPYRGAGPAMEGLMAGDIQVMFPTLTTVDSYIKAGSIKVLATTDAKRSPVYPDLPTVAESGYPTYHASLWYALVAPAKTPPAIIDGINASLRKIIDDPETNQKLEALGFQPGASSPDELKQTIVSDINTWAPIIDRLNLKVSN